MTPSMSLRKSSAPVLYLASVPFLGFLCLPCECIKDMCGHIKCVCAGQYDAAAPSACKSAANRDQWRLKRLYSSCSSTHSIKC